MTFREFGRWCNERACDGIWSLHEAKFCIGILENMFNVPFWKRRKVWKRIENGVMGVVDPINQRMTCDENSRSNSV